MVKQLFRLTCCVLFSTAFSATLLAYEEYTISSIDHNTGSQISVNYLNTETNTQKQTLLGDLDGISILPSIAASGNKQFIAVWQHFTSGKSGLQFSVGAKDDWSMPININTGLAENVSPIVVNIDSQVILFWSSTVEERDFIYYSLYNKGWSPARKVPGQNLAINIWPRVISEQGTHFIEWLASDPPEQPYTIQRHHLNTARLKSLFAGNARLAQPFSANTASGAFSKRPVQRRPDLANSATSSRHSQFGLKIEKGQTRIQVRKILQY